MRPQDFLLFLISKSTGLHQPMLFLYLLLEILADHFYDITWLR